MIRAVIYRIGFLGIVFITNILIANICHPANFGVISLLTVNGAILSLVIGAGFDSVMIYSVSHKKWTYSEAVHLVNRSSTVQWLIFLLLEFAWVGTFGKTLLSNSGPAFVWAECIYFTGLIFRERYQALFYAQDKAYPVNYCLLAVGGVFLIVLFAYSLFATLTFPTLYTLFCIQYFVQGLAVFILFRKRNQKSNGSGLGWSKLITAFRLSLLVLSSNLIQAVAYRVDYLFVNHFHTSYDLGIYSQANKFANLMWIVPGVAGAILTPRLARMDKESIKVIFRIAMALNCLIGCVTIVFSLLFYDFVLVPQYKPGFYALLIMFPGYLFWSFAMYFIAFFTSKGMFRTDFVGSLLCFCVIIACDWLLIPRYNFNGAAVANTVAYGIGFVYYLVYFLKTTGLRLRDLAVVGKDDLRRIKDLMSQ